MKHRLPPDQKEKLKRNQEFLDARIEERKKNIDAELLEIENNVANNNPGYKWIFDTPILLDKKLSFNNCVRAKKLLLKLKKQPNYITVGEFSEVTFCYKLISPTNQEGKFSAKFTCGSDTIKTTVLIGAKVVDWFSFTDHGLFNWINSKNIEDKTASSSKNLVHYNLV